MEFTEREFQIIHDKEFLLAKSRAISKTQELLTETRSELKDVFIKSTLNTNPEFDFKTEKISKGENYRGLPYLVLDYPAIFSAENIFAFRTMFWWGNFFSVTLQLQGKSLEFYRKRIIDKIELIKNQDIFICINKTPWEYHYEADNYRLLTNMDAEFMRKCSFLKLSKRIELDRWKDVPNLASVFFKQILEIVS